MCLHQKLTCTCGKADATLFHRDSILPEDVVVALYCPECRSETTFNPATMVEDTGWIIEYDMDAARFYLGNRGITEPLSPEALFDREFCTWYGLSPTDLEENAKMHQDLESLKKTNVALFMKRLREHRLARVAELKKEGWRKAQHA